MSKFELNMVELHDGLQCIIQVIADFYFNGDIAKIYELSVLDFMDYVIWLPEGTVLEIENSVNVQ